LPTWALFRAPLTRKKHKTGTAHIRQKARFKQESKRKRASGLSRNQDANALPA